MPLPGRLFRALRPIFALMIALTAMACAQAQTETPTALKDVTIAVTVTDRPTRLSAELIGLPVQNRLQDDFVPAGYRVVRAQPDAAQIWVKLTPHDDTKTLTATITLADRFLPTLPSPILMTMDPIAFDVPQAQDDSFAAAISEVTLALTIATQTCVSTPIHGAGLNAYGVGLLAGTVDVAAANCSLAADDLVSAGKLYQGALDTLSQANASVNAKLAPTVGLAWLDYKNDHASDGVDLLTALFAQAKLPDDRVGILRKRSALLALDFQFADAIADIKAAIALSPNDPSLYVELGQRILLTYEWDQVLDAYDQAIAIDPTYAPAYFQRGVLFYTEGPRANALKDFSKYLELAPNGEFAADAQSYIGGIQQTTAGEIQQGK